jgi:hypothetical protein
MSVTGGDVPARAAPLAVPVEGAPRAEGGRALRGLLIAGLVLVVFSFVRSFTDANELTSSGTFGARSCWQAWAACTRSAPAS